ncbi:MAG: flagellar biosynthesis protein FlhF [Caldimonas sp.]
MNVKRFTARTARDALSLVRQALGDDAVVLSTKPSAGGVEVLAMAPEGMRQVERLSATPPAAPGGASEGSKEASAAAAAKAPARAARIEPALDNVPVEEDVNRLSMSTLSFQDYVRERMLKRRQASLQESRAAEPVVEPQVGLDERLPSPLGAVRSTDVPGERAGVLEQRMAERTPAAPSTRASELLRSAPSLHDAERSNDNHPAAPAGGAQQAARDDAAEMMRELRSMKGLIEERFGALAFMERMQRQPGQARLTQKLLECGFSPALIRKLADGLGTEVTDESAWAASVLERNLASTDTVTPLEDVGGVYALVGATGVGKTTTTAKIAAAFATKYGAANLGLVTLDAYRVGAHEQLRAYGRILGVPVHTAHDRISLEDLLDLLSAKRMVLVDTAGMAQRDERTRELLEMISHRSVQKLLVINAASQGETIEDVLVAYRAASCAGIVLSKMDEAVKLGPAVDALIRHRLKVVGVANGQRVPEDWHRLSASALVQRALRGGGSSAYRLDASDVNLVFTAPHAAPASRPAAPF